MALDLIAACLGLAIAGLRSPSNSLEALVMTVTTSQPTATVARDLVRLVREGRNLEAVDRLYSPDVMSTEPTGPEGVPQTLRGLDAVRKKNDWWFGSHDVHETVVSGPFLGDDQFAVSYTFDFSPKPAGPRVRMTEMALYTVSNWQVVREEFFYHRP